MKRRFLLVLSLLLATACERNSYSTFSYRNKVFYSCELTKSPYNQLTTPGRFLSVRKGDGEIVITDSDGNRYEEPLTAIQNSTFIFGLGGLIIGTPTFNNDDMSIWAYAWDVPNATAPAHVSNSTSPETPPAKNAAAAGALIPAGFPPMTNPGLSTVTPPHSTTES